MSDLALNGSSTGRHIVYVLRSNPVTALAATGNVFNLALTVLFMLITLFFIYKDGAHIARQLDVVGERVLQHRWQRFSRVVPATVSATVIGMGVIAVGEGVVLGLAYWIAGVPSPVLLGVVTGFMALIPGGAPLSFTLVSLYLVGSGHPAAGVALFVWGSVELFIVDKTLRPRLVGGPVKLPFLPTFFALLPQHSGVRLPNHLRRLLADLKLATAQTLLSLAFLPDSAWRMLDAIGRTLARLAITRSNLLQWTTAAQSAISPRLNLRGFYRGMAGSTTLGLLVTAGVVAFAPASCVLRARHSNAPKVAIILRPSRRRRQRA